jgi:hypothetical protein
MGDNHLDAVVYPLQKRLVVPVTELNQAERNGILASMTGFPAITVPAGFSAPTKTAPLGVPAGMDILSKPWSEAKLLALEVAPTGRAAADRNGAAHADSKDEHGESALGRATHSRRTAQARV